MKNSQLELSITELQKHQYRQSRSTKYYYISKDRLHKKHSAELFIH